LQSTKKCTYPNVYQYFISLSKNTTKTNKILILPDLASAHYAKDNNWIRPQGRKFTKRPTDSADWKCLGELEKKGLQQQLSSKRCKVLDGKDQKRAEVHWNYGNL
jgi:hypothetical protein